MGLQVFGKLLVVLGYRIIGGIVADQMVCI